MAIHVIKTDDKAAPASMDGRTFQNFGLQVREVSPSGTVGRKEGGRVPSFHEADKTFKRLFEETRRNRRVESRR